MRVLKVGKTMRGTTAVGITYTERNRQGQLEKTDAKYCFFFRTGYDHHSTPLLFHSLSLIVQAFFVFLIGNQRTLLQSINMAVQRNVYGGLDFLTFTHYTGFGWVIIYS